jgi:hypothetical protein
MGVRATLNALLRPLGFEAVRKSSYGTDNFLVQTTLKFKQVVVREIAERLEYKVQRGPFEGMILPAHGAWSDHDIASKLVGSYEEELFPTILELAKVPFRSIVNIGASEGYYAIGMKRLVPDATVYTYDIDENSFQALEDCQKLNGVSVKRLDAFKCADPFPGNLKDWNLPSLFIIDCEGCEARVVDFPQEVLVKSHFLIEVHDLFIPGITTKLTDFLSNTHDVTVIPQRSRNFDDYPELEKYSELKKAIILDEYRDGKMEWLYAKPKS